MGNRNQDLVPMRCVTHRSRMPAKADVAIAPIKPSQLRLLLIAGAITCLPSNAPQALRSEGRASEDGDP